VCNDPAAMPHEQYRELGKTGIKVSEIGFGAWPSADRRKRRVADRNRDGRRMMNRAPDLGAQPISASTSSTRPTATARTHESLLGIVGCVARGRRRHRHVRSQCAHCAANCGRISLKHPQSSRRRNGRCVGRTDPSISNQLRQSDAARISPPPRRDSGSDGASAVMSAESAIGSSPISSTPEYCIEIMTHVWEYALASALTRAESGAPARISFPMAKERVT